MLLYFVRLLKVQGRSIVLLRRNWEKRSRNVDLD